MAAVGGAYLLKDSDAMIPFAITLFVASISSALFRYMLIMLHGGAAGRVHLGRIRHLRHQRHLSGERAEYARASQRLAMMDRDFTAADYEILLDLDTYSQRFRRFLDGASEEEIEQLPVCEYKSKKKRKSSTNCCDDKCTAKCETNGDGEKGENQISASTESDEEEDEFSSLAGATSKKCMICLEDFADGMMIRTLPCFHRFMAECIDHWLLQQAKCPVCKKSIREDFDLS